MLDNLVSQPALMTATTAAGYRRYPVPASAPAGRVAFVGADAGVARVLEAPDHGDDWRFEIVPSAETLLSRPRPAAPVCVVIDLGPLGPGGVALQGAFAAQGASVVFIVGPADIATAVQAIRAGAVEVLARPPAPAALLAAVHAALAQSAQRRRDAAALQTLRGCYGQLSARERQVMELVAAGRLNKQIAFELGISEITVKVHRGRVMQKMCARSLAELVRMSLRLAPETALAA